MATGDAYQFSNNGIAVTANVRAQRTLLRQVELAFTGGATFFMLFDKSTVPINGDTPVMCFNLGAAGTPQVIPMQPEGFTFANGLGYAFSTTIANLTIAAVNAAVAMQGRDL